MDKYPQQTLDRITHFVRDWRERCWVERRPTQVTLFECAEPIPYVEALRQTYTPIAVGAAWGYPWCTAWFHVQGACPPAWAGDTAALLLDTGSEALVWHDGEPAHGLDEHHQEYLFPASGAVDLYIEAAGNVRNLLESPGTFTLRRAELARWDRAAWALYHDMRVLLELAQALPVEAPRRARIIVALNDVVTLFRRDASADLAAARAILAPHLACRAGGGATEVAAVGQTHIDTAWLWPIRETIRKCARSFATVLSYLAEYPDYRFIQSQPQLYAYIRDHYPGLYARITQAVADGRWEPEGAMWVEPDCHLPSGESLIRQILHGTRFFREEFGVDNTLLWLPDVFGFTAALPQIMRGCGLRYFLTTKLSWNRFNTFPHSTFWWQGIDGTRVLAHHPPTQCNGTMTPGEALWGESHFRDHGRSDTWLYAYGWGDGGGGPTREMLEALPRMRDLDGLPRLHPTPVRAWLPRMEAEARDLCTWVGELYLELHRGTFTTHGQVKRGNRQGEWLLREIECLTAIGPEGVEAYPRAELDRLWKLLLLHQFHDILPGTSIGWVYQDTARDHAEIQQAGGVLLDQALGAFTQRIETTDLTRPVLVWNTLSFARGGVVSVPWDSEATVAAYPPRGAATRTQVTEEAGERRLLIEVADAPSMGYVVYDLRAGESDTPTDRVHATERMLENDLVRITVNDLGEIVSYYDKQAEREIIAAGQVGNQFQLFDETKADAWDIEPYFAEAPRETVREARLTVLEEGPLRATLCLERTLSARASLRQYIRLEANSRRIDFVTTVAWQEEAALLKVAFPVRVHSDHATYNIQFGHLERPTHHNTAWDLARYEVPAQKWADLSEGDYGVALLNDCKYGYDILGNVMRLSLLRATSYPDPAADRGTHQFTYSLLPHPGSVEQSSVPLAGYDLNVPLRALPLPVQAGSLARAHSYFRLDKPNLIIETVKRAEDDDGIIVRLYEAYNRRGTARLMLNGLCRRATRTDLLERDGEELPVCGGAVEFAYRPFEIITLRLR